MKVKKYKIWTSSINVLPCKSLLWNNSSVVFIFCASLGLIQATLVKSVSHHHLGTCPNGGHFWCFSLYIAHSSSIYRYHAVFISDFVNRKLTGFLYNNRLSAFGGKIRRNIIVAILSNGLRTTWINLIGTFTVFIISSNSFQNFGDSNNFEVLPPFLSPIT